jgi:predicted HTH transcriptional regulator
MHYHGTVVQKPIPSYQIYKGTVFELVDQAVDFVMSKINRYVGTRVNGPQAPVKYELPREAVMEAIVNAVAHRDYASNASVQVMLFTDRLEVWNPGQLPPTLTLEDLRGPHASIPRNPLIAEPMYLAHYAEKAGSGILDMISLLRKEGLPEPQFRQSGGQFVQTLWRPKNGQATKAKKDIEKDLEKRSEKWSEKMLSKNELAIVYAIRDNPLISRKELSSKIEISQSTIQKHIEALKKKGVLKRVGPDKGGHWEILK